jgi:membrane fusion protein (multidrug efflux system)
MRIVVQALVVVGLGAAGAAGWYAFQQWGAGSTATANPARATAPVPVEVIAARSGAVREVAESVGTVRANESITITAKQTGNIAAINFSEGQKVRTGAVLIDLEAKERRADVDQSRADLEQARAQRDEIRQRLDRAKQLKATGSVTEARLDELESQLRAADGRIRASEAKLRGMDARLDDNRITAPFEGRVGLRQVSLGALVQPGTTITTLDDVSKVKLDFAIPENFLGKLKTGQRVLARSQAFINRHFEGVVSVVDSRVDPATRAVRVNALFENSDEALKPGMFLNVELALAERQDAVIVPEETLIAEGGRQFVFVVSEGRAERREVRIGQRLQGEVEIASGLKIGEQVIARGIQKVRHNQPVAARPLRPMS